MNLSDLYKHDTRIRNRKIMRERSGIDWPTILWLSVIIAFPAGFIAGYLIKALWG